MIKYGKLTLYLLIAVLAVWLLVPRISSRWDIVENEEDLRGKDAYLNSLSGIVQGQKGPNILVILADDLSPYDLSFIHSDTGIAVPNIEALAAGGTIFSDASASSPICSPSRAGLLTGRIQNRSGFDSQPMQLYPAFPLFYYGSRFFLDTDEMTMVDFGTYPALSELGKQGVPKSEIMLQEILGAAGYETALIGKWHLGYGDEQHPLNRGFDRFYGFLEAFTFYDDPDKDDVVSFRHDLFWEKHIWKQKRKGPCAIEDQGTEVHEDSHLTDAIAEKTLGFIENHKDRHTGKPFLVYASFSAPHTPFQELKTYYDRFAHIEDENRRIYAALISHLDDAVGRIVTGLRDRGILEETLIFFASDNGGASYTGATDNGILAGGKMSQFQGGIQVPLILHWPGKVPSGLIYDRAVSLLDIFSTTLAAANIPLPRDRIIDGVDLIPYLQGDNASVPHDTLFWKSDFNLALRKGDWKILVNLRSGQKKLYNLVDDPGESRDLSARYPDRLKDLESEVLEINSQCRPPLWPRVMDFEIEVHGEVFEFAT